jgi:hypothetical protein
VQTRLKYMHCGMFRYVDILCWFWGAYPAHFVSMDSLEEL